MLRTCHLPLQVQGGNIEIEVAEVIGGTQRNLVIGVQGRTFAEGVDADQFAQNLTDPQLRELAQSYPAFFQRELDAREHAHLQKLPAKPATISVARKDGKEQVKADLVGNRLAVHKDGSDWVVTHVPTGLATGVRAGTKGEAVHAEGIMTASTAVPSAEDVARKNVRVQGVWVSDTSHLYQSIRLVMSGRFPFEKLVTHRFSLDEATAALETMERQEAIKAVLIP